MAEPTGASESSDERQVLGSLFVTAGIVDVQRLGAIQDSQANPASSLGEIFSDIGFDYEFVAAAKDILLIASHDQETNNDKRFYGSWHYRDEGIVMAGNEDGRFSQMTRDRVTNTTTAINVTNIPSVIVATPTYDVSGITGYGLNYALLGEAGEQNTKINAEFSLDGKVKFNDFSLTRDNKTVSMQLTINEQGSEEFFNFRDLSAKTPRTEIFKVVFDASGQPIQIEELQSTRLKRNGVIKDTTSAEFVRYLALATGAKNLANEELQAAGLANFNGTDFQRLEQQALQHIREIADATQQDHDIQDAAKMINRRITGEDGKPIEASATDLSVHNSAFVRFGLGNSHNDGINSQDNLFSPAEAIELVDSILSPPSRGGTPRTALGTRR
ncbi:MAG: hypothetical protein ACOYJ2_07195 [Rickettsiales bacterium]